MIRRRTGGTDAVAVRGGAGGQAVAAVPQVTKDELMPVYNWSAIYLGNAADMDPDDADSTAENAAALLGTYGSAGAPLRNNIVDVVANDADGDTNINYDDPAETMTIDGVSHTLDSGAVFNATITYMDGTTATITAVVLQTENGDLYLAPEMSNNADLAAMEAKPIRSLTLDSLNTNTTTIGANRQQTNFMCFAAGTAIATPHGARPVESLRPGDRISLHGGGWRALRWIGCRHVSLARQIADPRARCVVIAPDALGPGWPRAPLRVSQQHRLLISTPVARRMFGQDEVLVAAKKLVGLPGIALDQPRAALRYFHIALDRHDIVLAEGAPAESLLPGPEALRTFDDGAARALEALLTDAAHIPARPIVEGRRVQSFVDRMQRRRARQEARA